jgi:hypothetical protein
MNRRPMMYHGSYQFGKAYQEEMRRIAGVDDEQDNEIRAQRRSQKQRLPGGLSGRKKKARSDSPTIWIPNRSSNESPLGGEGTLPGLLMLVLFFVLMALRTM